MNYEFFIEFVQLYIFYTTLGRTHLTFGAWAPIRVDGKLSVCSPSRISVPLKLLHLYTVRISDTFIE